MTHHRYQPTGRTTRLASGFVGALIGLGVVAAVVQGMASRSDGQSLGQFVATQRAAAVPPVAQATPPAVPAPADAPVAADAV
ncbi:MAG: hypothetical protein JNL85_00880 [Rubrivivax sp.]|nr:hypothetical protein [Rubrivivax sp.]